MLLAETVTVVGCVLAIGTAFIAGTAQNLMNYIQALFSFVNARCSRSSSSACSGSG
jgi:SSS family solute:Na+ symporter